jgi:hypothetical protein
MSCSVFSAPYTREAFERHRPNLSNQFDMCIYASVALQAQHDEFKRFAWPAIELSTVMAVCQVLGQDALEYAKAVISFEDVGQASPPIVRRCGEWWFFDRLRYKCEQSRLTRASPIPKKFFYRLLSDPFSKRLPQHCVRRWKTK